MPRDVRTAIRNAMGEVIGFKKPGRKPLAGKKPRAVQAARATGARKKKPRAGAVRPMTQNRR